MRLLVDCGNTATKWRLINQAGLLISEQREQTTFFDGLVAVLHSHSPVMLEVFVASVAGGSTLASLERALNSLEGFEYSLHIVKVIPEYLGLTIAYSDSRQLGVDRWLAMLAVVHHFDASVLLVSAGTAITVDVIAEDGQHRGGLIAPGWWLLKRSLAEGTAQLGIASKIELVGSPSLGLNTYDCIEKGVSSMLLSFISSAAAQFGKNISRKILIGGDAPQISKKIEGFVVREGLVLDGLQLYAADHANIR